MRKDKSYTIPQESYNLKNEPGAFKVNFMIVGVQKGGTTALAHFLDKHPQIHITPLKEAHFFDQDTLFESGLPDYNRYHSLFQPEKKPDLKMIGEASPSYIFLPNIAPRLKEYNPDLKLIVLLRHPVERAFSHYNMMVEHHKEYLPFYNALRLEEIRLAAARNSVYMGPRTLYSYKTRGFYVHQLQNLFNYFPREQILIIQSEDLSNHHHKTLKKIFNFLRVADAPEIEPARLLVGKYSPLTGRLRDELLKLYEAETTELEHLLGWDLTDWRK